MINLENINKSYFTDTIETSALNSINLEINSGDFIALLGPSGCGKSTLLNSIGLLDPIDSGHYWFEGKDLMQLNKKEVIEFRKNNLGFIFQNFNLIDELSVKENIELPLLYQGIGLKERTKRVTELAEKLGISHRLDHKPLQLSGGQQQRVAIARAIITRPRLILADEPTGNLDSNSGNDVMTLLAELNDSGSTILMVTHSPEHTKYCSKVVQMKDGQIMSPKVQLSEVG